MAWGVLFCICIAKLFTENFSKNLNLDDSGISLFLLSLLELILSCISIPEVPSWLRRFLVEGFPQRSILGLTCLSLYIVQLSDDVICIAAVYADDNTLYSKSDQAFDLWQQLKLGSELEPDLRDIFWTESRKRLVGFKVGKTQLVPFDQFISSVVDLKMDGHFLEEKSSFKVLGSSFSSKLDWVSYTVSMTKTATNKIIDSFYEVSFP